MSLLATMVLFPFTGLLAMHNSHINTKLSGSLLQYSWITLVLLFVVLFWHRDNLFQRLQSLVHIQRVFMMMMLLLLEPKFGDSQVEEENDQKIEDDQEPASSRDCLDIKKGDGSIHRDEVEVVMRSLGLANGREGGEGAIDEWIGCNELSRLFEVKEPSLEELRGAFDVFDENKDEFIDAQELQRILCLLGLKEGLEMENCRRMIRHFDQDGDERIDLFEFTRFMETSFC